MHLEIKEYCYHYILCSLVDLEIEGVFLSLPSV